MYKCTCIGRKKQISILVKWQSTPVKHMDCERFEFARVYSDLQNCLLRELCQGELDANLLVWVLLLFLSCTERINRLVVTFSKVNVS